MMSEANYHQLLQDALREIRRLRTDRDELIKIRDSQPIAAPIAIVGMACRFPQANSPEALYAAARNRQDCIGNVPQERWDIKEYYDPDHDAQGKMATKAGGFLTDVRGFDASFFGISPREAKLMDPQQRMLLETTWEALERAAIAPDSLYGKSVGVFVGLSNLEYPNVVRAAGDPGLIDSHFGTGNAGSIAAGRIAYLLGVHGPAMIVDTACSSSLVALHLAMNSLREGECELAIVGGVNLMLLPETFIHFSNARMLSPDGRCKPFSNRADGYGRGEGCGVVVLKRRDDAVRDADPIDALIRGSSIKHDGRSAGLTAPNGTSQEMVIRAALQNAGLTEADVHFVEAHGTGTPLGDPIEAAALSRVYGKDRTATKPLWVTAIKANIGHTEAGAGMAGLIHAVQCLKHRCLSPLLHYGDRSEHITSHALGFPTDAMDMEQVVGPLRAGVSSFGFSGTNAHVLLEEFQAKLENHEETAVKVQSNSPQLFVFSAKSEQALNEVALNFRGWLAEQNEAVLERIATTLLHGRSHYTNRFAFEVSSVTEAVEKLDQFILGNSAEIVAGDSLAAKRYLSCDNIKDTLPKKHGHPRLVMPTYPFQHTEFWVQSASSVEQKQVRAPDAVVTVIEKIATEVHEDLSLLIFGSPVLSTGSWLQALLQIPRVREANRVSFGEIEFLSVAPVSHSTLQDFTFSIDEDVENRMEWRAYVGTNVDHKDTPRLTGRCSVSTSSEWLGGSLEERRVQTLEPMKVGELASRLANLGYESAAFTANVEQLSVGPNDCLVSMRPKLVPFAPSERKTDHTAFVAVEAALGATAAILLSQTIEAIDATSFLPTAVRRFDWFGCQNEVRWSLVRLRPRTVSHAIEVDVYAWDVASKPVFQMLGVRLEGFSGALHVSTGQNDLDDTSKTEAASEQDQLTVNKLLALPREQRSSSLQEYLVRELAKEMELSEKDIPLEQPLAELGLDSLMIFRLSIQLETELGVTLDSRALLGGITLRGLTESLLWKLTLVDTEGKPG